MDENAKLAKRLTEVYAKLLGERQRLIQPPKYVTRLRADRQAYAAAADERLQRIAKIDSDIPHLKCVIIMLDPQCDVDQIKPKRPRALNNVSMPKGIVGTALEILKQATFPLAVSEIVQIMGERYDLDLSTVTERQRYYDAINHAFSKTSSEDLIEFPGDLPDNPHWRRKWYWKYSHPL